MQMPLRLLIVEDSEDDTLLLLRALRQTGYQPTYQRVETSTDFLTALTGQTWDLIIADYAMPHFSGLMALHLLKEQGHDVPFIVVSGAIGEDVAVEAMKAGAHDYVMKGNLARLGPAVARELREASMRQERRQAAVALQQSEERLRQANAALFQLARSPHLLDGHLDAALRETTETAGRMLAVTRACVWLYNQERTIARCHTRYDADSQTHGSGPELMVGDYPVYFNAIADQRVLAIADTQHDPRTREFLECYLLPQGITSMLNAAVRLQGDIVGVMALEHTGPARQWKPEEETLAGSIADLVSLALEAHARQRMQEALRQSEERYRDLFENANDIIYTRDMEGRITSINKKVELLTGVPRDQILGMNIADIVAPEYLEVIRSTMALKLERALPQTVFEVEAVKRNGQRIPFEVNSRLMYENGQPVGVQGIARDISERRHLEEQLRQAQKMEAIGRLAGGIAHDFNNLLTAILGYSHMIVERLPQHDPTYAEIAEIEKAAQRAAALTRQLLAFSRKQVLQPKILDLNMVVADMEVMLRRLIGEDIDLTTQLNPTVQHVKADPSQLEQVIMNLVINARDAMPQGGTLRLETSNFRVEPHVVTPQTDVQPGGYARLVVSDTGTGMDKATLSCIFDPFFTTKEQGTGLGLSTVYGIVKQSSGHIWVNSTPGAGTTFTILLPQVQALQSPGAMEPGKALLQTGSETILLVEDDEAVRQLVLHVLQHYGYSTLEARHARDAIALCAQHDGMIHLMVTDVVMPGMSGRELAERLAQSRPDMRVLYMSGYAADRALSAQGLAVGETPFLQKPFTPQTFAYKIREVLDR
ncbi:MAG: response regulator [Candidatus Tectimicrobiota bacterium]